MDLLALLFLEFKQLLHLEVVSGPLRVLKLNFITNQDDIAFWDFLGYLFISYCLQVVK